MSSYDAACKRILSERVILARIMKECLPEFRDCDVDAIANEYILDDPVVGALPVGEVAPRVAGGGVEDASAAEGRVTFDIQFSAAAPGEDGPIGLVVNVEAQGETNLPYPLMNRAQYYCARLLARQHGTVFVRSDYGKLRKVYSIWVCLRPPRGLENSISRYAFAREDLTGPLPNLDETVDLMSIVVVRLGAPGSAGYDGVLGLLGTLLSKEVARAEKCRVLEQEYGIELTDKLEDEVAMMGTIGELVFKEGRAEGLAAGRAEGQRELLTALCDRMGWTLEEALDRAGVPEEERAAYRSDASGADR